MTTRDQLTTPESTLDADLLRGNRNKRTLQQLQRRAENVADNDNLPSLFDTAKEMREGDGSEQSVGKLVPKARKQVFRPVLRSAVTKTEDFFKQMQTYFGDVGQMVIECHASDRTIVERFNIAETPGTEVFSMCVKNNGHVELSYTWHNLSGTACAEEFDESGNLTRTNKAKGEKSFRRRGSSSMFYTQKEGSLVTSSKSKQHFSLHNDLRSGKATIKSEDPVTAEDKIEFSILCGPHRAFDVDSAGVNFVVVQQSPASDSQRKVRLFGRQQEYTPVSNRREWSDIDLFLHSLATIDTIYEPPGQPFQPSDVCFYKKGGKEVLLIADEINDAIHVVEVESSQFTFLGYLCPGHPLLVQPTALTVDNSDRVWVACRGRVILVVQPDMDTFRLTYGMGRRWLPDGF